MEREPARVLVLYTGGTIGMRAGPRGYVPAPGHLARSLERLPPFHDPTLPAFTTPPSRHGRRVHYTIKEYDPLLDSSNMGPEDWARIALDVERHYADHDAFVVLHGTDTMAYTASALSFMLENLAKPVILTGAQIPLDQPRSDAVDNLLGALTLAGHYEIPEVGLFFGQHLLRGNRTQKMDASGFQAFASGNHPPLATVGTEIEVHWERIARPPAGPLRVHTRMSRNVAALRIFPGITAQILSNFLQPPLAGLVLETYGTGNAPDRRQDFLDALRAATQRGVVVVNCTQCHRGTVTPAYAAGTALVEAGVAVGSDMTSEAALTKLAFLLGQDLPPTEVKRLAAVNLRGELTEPHEDRFTHRDRDLVRILAKHIGDTQALLAQGPPGALQGTLVPVLLCSAAAQGEAESIQQLAAAGADVNRPDYDGRTPLHLAAAGGHLEAARLLLARGAHVNARDRRGTTPLADAIRNRHSTVADLLQEHGAVW